MILPFLPESPRWLIYFGRREEALVVLTQTHVNGDATRDFVVLAQYKEIIDTMDYERDKGERLTITQMIKDPFHKEESHVGS